MLSRMPLWAQRTLIIGLPLLGFFFALYLFVPRYQAFRRDQAELQKVQPVVAYKSELIERAKKRGKIPPVIARVPATPNEPVMFLRELNQLATSSGVRLTNYSQTASPVTNPGGDAAGANNAAAPATPELPPGTTPETLQLSASGDYRAMALFFARLETYGRLVSVHNVNMTAASGGSENAGADNLSAQFQITRYTGEDTVVNNAAAAAPS